MKTRFSILSLLLAQNLCALPAVAEITYIDSAHPLPELSDPKVLDYQHHMLVVDNHGSALYPVVKRHDDRNGQPQYDVQLYGMKDERTHELANAKRYRQQLENYLNGMFQKMEQEHAQEIVIYVHSGLNNVEGAVRKTAYLTDYFRTKEPEKKIYYIGICWNSALGPTYYEHLFRVREGLRQPARAILSSPAALLADVGSALARLPLRSIDLLYNDAESINPNGFSRHRLAEARARYLVQQTNNQPRQPGAQVIDLGDERDWPARRGTQRAGWRRGRQR